MKATNPARHLGLPEAYASDLITHDRRDLEKSPPSRLFVWAVRDAGTYLCLKPERTLESLLSQVLDEPSWNVFRWTASKLERVR